MKNICISGLPPILKEDELWDTIGEIAEDLESPEIKFNDCQYSSDRKRIMVELESEEKLELLRKAKNLRNIPRWKNVFLRPGLTPAECAIQYELRCLRRKKIEEQPEKRWKISEGKIVEQLPMEVFDSKGSTVRETAKSLSTIDELSMKLSSFC